MVLVAKHDAPVDAGWRCRKGETMIGSVQPLVGPLARAAHAGAPFIVDCAVGQPGRNHPLFADFLKRSQAREARQPPRRSGLFIKGETHVEELATP
jgi:hypothetical protein